MVEDADIVDVLRLLAKQNDLNLHIHQDVKGKVTVRFNDVLLQEVLDSILRANGLDYVAYRDVILVKPASQSVAGELQTKVYALKYLDAHAMSQSLTSVLTPKGKATVVPVSMEKEATKDEQAASGLLVVTDTPAALGEVDALVEKLDAPMAQIMIEVQLIETTLSDEEKLGINWSISASISDETAVYDLHHLNAEGFRFGKLSLTELGVAMDALRTRGNTKLISNPKITTIENQTAEISVGTTVPIPQREIDERGRERITIEERDVSVRLSVTPRLNESDVITMTVRPQVEEITRWTEIESFPYPITSKRSVTTHVRVKDGEGIAIGGLVKENTIKTKNKLRILGDIPLLGYLFQHGETTKEKTDLLIFITPHVVK
jgi:type II secretory pathway component GspD/PulD (secretin)